MTENEKIDEIIAYAIYRQGRFWGNDFLNQGGTGRHSRGTKTTLTYVDVNRIIALLKSKGVAESVNFGSDNDFNLLGDWNELQKGWEYYLQTEEKKSKKSIDLSGNIGVIQIADNSPHSSFVVSESKIEHTEKNNVQKDSQAKKTKWTKEYPVLAGIIIIIASTIILWGIKILIVNVIHVNSNIIDINP